jgi:hypothetical protein
MNGSYTLDGGARHKRRDNFLVIGSGVYDAYYR